MQRRVLDAFRNKARRLFGCRWPLAHASFLFVVAWRAALLILDCVASPLGRLGFDGSFSPPISRSGSLALLWTTRWERHVLARGGCLPCQSASLFATSQGDATGPPAVVFGLHERPAAADFC